MAEYETLIKIADFIKTKTKLRPEVAVVLGSGLGDFVKSLRVEDEILYSEIKGFPLSTVAGHAGKLVFGYAGKTPVVIMQGRVHYYEDYDMDKVVMPIRILKLIGVKAVLLTNAAGGINKKFKPGDLMLITDHISNFVPSPLIGKNIDEFGPRFPDMTHVYDKNLNSVLKNIAALNNIEIKTGVYVQTTGPNYETPQEIKMFGILGADAVGMSTVCEAIAARHMGMSVCGLSCITNMAAGITGNELSHEEVQETTAKVQEQINILVKGFLTQLSNF